MYYTAIINRVVSIDLGLANLFYVIRDPLLVKIFLGITMLGKWWIAAIIVLTVSIIFYFKNRRQYIIPFFISVGAGFLTGMVGKLIWHRPRPMEMAVYIEHSWSFPSGHAILAVSLYGFLIYFFWKNLKKQPHKLAALFFGLLVIIAVGFSRLYLGVHYLSDVLAGYMVGLFWLILSIGLIEHKKNTPT